jgi:DNA primase
LNASEGRIAKNAKWFKAFWLDLDCGENKPYETQSIALDALKQFVTDTGLPRPTIVNSGRGVHVYWVLTAPIFYNDWKPTAEAFKKFCAAYHLHADPSVTADAARILRVPETLN